MNHFRGMKFLTRTYPLRTRVIVALASLCGILVTVSLDLALPNIELSYLYSFPLLSLTWAFGLRAGIPAACVVAAMSSYINELDLHRGFWWETAAGIILLGGYILSVWLFNRMVALSARAVRESQNRYLAEASRIFAASLDADVAVTTLAALCAPRIAEWCAIYLAEDDGRMRLAAVAHADPARAAVWRDLDRRYPIRVGDGGPLSLVMGSGRPKLIPDLQAVLRLFAQDPVHHNELSQFGFRSSICLPLNAHGTALGTLSLVKGTSGPPFDEGDVSFAEDLSLRAASAIENARLYTQARRAARSMEFVSEASKTLAASLDSERIFYNITHLAIQDFCDWCALNLLQPAGIVTAAIAHIDATKQGAIDDLRRTSYIRADAPLGAAHVIRTGHTEQFEFSDEMLLRTLGDPTHISAVRSLGYGRALVVPLMARGNTLGSLTFTRTRTRTPFDEHDIAIAEEVARRAAMALENARLYEREHHVADTLQRASLPASLPIVPGLQFDAAYMPGARESDIGGDWYDAFSLPDGRIVFSIGDVSGRGLQAAVTMGKVREALRAFAIAADSPRDVLLAADRALQLDSRPAIVTAIIGVLNPVTHELRYASAGHPPPLLALASGEIQKLAAGGLPLGLRDDDAIPEYHLMLPINSSLLLYTDGIIERERDLISGERELADALAAEVQNPSESPAESIYKRICDRAAEDDIALLYIHVTSIEHRPLSLRVPAVAASARFLRQVIERYATSSGMDRDRIFDLQVATGEAVANAVEHAYGVDSGDIVLTMHIEHGDLLLEIKDNGTWRRTREEGRGRGLELMRALADGLDVITVAGSTEVRLRFGLADTPAITTRAG